jgi:hypothetical protein
MAPDTLLYNSSYQVCRKCHPTINSILIFKDWNDLYFNLFFIAQKLINEKRIKGGFFLWIYIFKHVV